VTLSTLAFSKALNVLLLLLLNVLLLCCAAPQKRVPPTAGALVSNASRADLFYPLLDVVLFTLTREEVPGRDRVESCWRFRFFYSIYISQHTGARRRVFNVFDRLTGAQSNRSECMRGSSCFFELLVQDRL